MGSESDGAVAWVVDVANVMGSRPDGWWRDRAGAARRLLDQMARTGRDGMVAVVEGRARDIPDVPGIEVVRAAGSGDDEIVDQARRHAACTVVTADRGLRARLPTGTHVMGPREFLSHLPT